jgi:serine/threonine protein kinase
MGIVFARDVSLTGRSRSSSSSDSRATPISGAIPAGSADGCVTAHPHIVPIHAVEAHDDVVFFVMSYVEGESLGDRVRRRGQLGARARWRGSTRKSRGALPRPCTRHRASRRVKPDNILVDRESGRAMVTDFWYCPRDVGRVRPAAPAGTPHYLSPEQTRGEPGDARSDLYALGVTAWHALTGAHPFEAPNVAILLVRQSTESAPSLRTVVPDVPARLASAVDRCLARLPAERWASAEELAVELNAVRARSGELPAPVRAWVREALPAGNDIGMGVGGVAASLGVWTLLGVLNAGTGVASGIDSIFISFTMTVAASLFEDSRWSALARWPWQRVISSNRDMITPQPDWLWWKRMRTAWRSEARFT